MGLEVVLEFLEHVVEHHALLAHLVDGVEDRFDLSDLDVMPIFGLLEFLFQLFDFGFGRILLFFIDLNADLLLVGYFLL